MITAVEQEGWNRAGERDGVVPGSALRDRTRAGVLRDLGRGDAAVTAGRAAARDSGGLARGVVQIPPELEAPDTIVAVGQGHSPRPTPARRLAPPGRRGAPAVIAASLLGVGVACGIAGLFPAYLAGASLATQPAELVPHAIYFAVWGASALLILLGGTRLRVGAMLGLGASIVTFGLFFADAGEAIAGGANTMGACLALGLAGGLPARPALRGRFQAPAGPGTGQAAWPQEQGLVLALALAALGAAVAFAPSWDSYILRTSAGSDSIPDRGQRLREPGAGDRRGPRRHGGADRGGRAGGSAGAPVREGVAAACRCDHPDGGSGDLGARPARRGHLTGPVRHLALPRPLRPASRSALVSLRSSGIYVPSSWRWPRRAHGCFSGRARPS